MGCPSRRIERLREEHVGSHEDQVARLNVPTVLDAVEELPSRPGGARLHDDLAQAEARRVDRVENPITTRQRIWLCRAIAFGGGNDPLGCSASGRDLEDAAAKRSTTQQNPIV